MEKIVRELKLARGVLINGDQVLLVRDVRPGEGHYFLPGGSVEPGESVKAALSREWFEELGWEISVGDFRGCLEAKWSYNRKSDNASVDVFEVNFIFSVTASQEQILEVPVSKESHLQFQWIPISSLNEINLLPTPMKQIIRKLKGSGTSQSAIWESTL